MIDNDLAQFSKILDSLSEYYQRDPLSPMAVKIYFSALKQYSLETLGDAVNAHIKHPTNGKFYPKAADLILHLEGGAITADQVIAAARLADTPFGILSLLHIGSWDLKRMNGFDLKQRAEEVLQLLPQWKQRCAAGGYTPHQISIMIKHDVDPLGAFYTGLAAPINKDMLADRVEHVKSTEQHHYLLDPPYEEQPANPVPLAQTLAKLEKPE